MQPRTAKSLRRTERGVQLRGGPRRGDLARAVQHVEVAAPAGGLGDEARQGDVALRRDLRAQRADERVEVVEQVRDAEREHGREAPVGERQRGQVGLDQADPRRDRVAVPRQPARGALEHPAAEVDQDGGPARAPVQVGRRRGAAGRRLQHRAGARGQRAGREVLVLARRAAPGDAVVDARADQPVVDRGAPVVRRAGLVDLGLDSPHGETVARILLHVEKTTKTRLLDHALDLLGREGAGALTVRAVEDAAGVPHGSVRHHFGDRGGLVRALFDHLAEREGGVAVNPPEAFAHWLGAGRTLTLARYELFLMAARDPTLRAPLVAARDRFVALAAERVGPEAAPAAVAAIDGLVLDALVRGERDPAKLSAAATRLTTPAA